MFNTSLYDEKTFYKQFINDLLRAEREVIIESPFISNSRMKRLHATFEKLINKDVKVYVITRAPNLHEGTWAQQSDQAIKWFEEAGVQVLVTTNNHHRKLAIIDRDILWEGSLNILSQNNSREVMRRIEGENHAQDMFDFLKLSKFI